MCLKMYILEDVFYRNKSKTDWQYSYMFILLLVSTRNLDDVWLAGWLIDGLIDSFVHWFIGFDLILFWSDLTWFDWLTWFDGVEEMEGQIEEHIAWTKGETNDKGWNEMTWHGMTWNEMEWNEMNECMSERTHEFITWYDKILQQRLSSPNPFLVTHTSSPSRTEVEAPCWSQKTLDWL